MMRILLVLAVFGTCFFSSFSPVYANTDDIILEKPILQGNPTINASERDSISIMEQYTKMIFKFIAGLTALIAVLVIIGSGIRMMLAAGDGQSLETAKTDIVQALSGIALLFLIGVILHTINPNFFQF